MGRKVADQFVDIRAAAGIKRIYGIVGDTLNAITDALRRPGKTGWIHVYHEEAGAFAAADEAHVTGELAVCAGGCGRGNLHLINTPAERLRASIVHALKGKEHVKWDNPYDAALGTMGSPSGLSGLDPGCCRAASHAYFPVPGEGLFALPLMLLDMIVSYTVSATALLAKGQTNAYRTVRSVFHRCLFSGSRNRNLGAAGALRP